MLFFELIFSIRRILYFVPKNPFISPAFLPKINPGNLLTQLLFSQKIIPIPQLLLLIQDS